MKAKIARLLAACRHSAAEPLNTGLEAAVDLASPEKSALAKKAKDAASAAVLLLLINAALVWAVVLLA